MSKNLRQYSLDTEVLTPTRLFQNDDIYPIILKKQAVTLLDHEPIYTYCY